MAGGPQSNASVYDAPDCGFDNPERAGNIDACMKHEAR
jgi:hypothetical protein